MSIKVTFQKRERGQQGLVQVEAIGFTGTTCEAATARIERALGMRVEQIKKPEFYDEVADAVREQIQEGLGS